VGVGDILGSGACIRVKGYTLRQLDRKCKSPLLLTS
jgi:hypothetical protein